MSTAEVNGRLNSELLPLLVTWESSGRMPRRLFPLLGELGRLGSATEDIEEAIRFLEELAGSGSLRLCLAVRDHLLATRYLHSYGSPQLRELLPALDRGSKMAASALPEPGADSGTATVTTETSDTVVVSGMVPVTATVAECDLVLLAGRGRQGLSLVAIELDSIGIKLLPHPIGFELHLHRVEIDTNRILGEPSRGGLLLHAEQPLAQLTEAAIMIAAAKRSLSALATGAILMKPADKLRRRLYRAANSSKKNDRSLAKRSAAVSEQAQDLVARVARERLRQIARDQLLSECWSALGLTEQPFDIPPETDPGAPATDAPQEPEGDTMPAPVPATVAELIGSLPDRFRGARAGDWTATFHFVLADDQQPHWTVTIKQGRCRVRAGLHDEADCLVRMKATTYIGIESGTINPQAAFMTGRVRVSDLAQMMRYIKLFTPFQATGRHHG